jgi:C1A family cysteine protease
MPELRERRIGHYGWTPDLPDARDHLFAAPLAAIGPLPASMDLRPKCPPVYDQGRIGSCTANSIAGAFEFLLLNEGQQDFTPSRLFIYYNERVIEHTVHTDSGAQLRDGVKSVAQLGVCPETEWPYDDTPPPSDGAPWPPNAEAGKKPTKQCYTDALKHTVKSYQRVARGLTQMKGCLAQGYPFVFGFTVYESFESQQVAKTGIVPMPASGEQVLGGHAVLAVGYNDADQRFIVRNSWGTGWGDAGYFHMPYAYLTDAGLASDFWTLRLV